MNRCFKRSCLVCGADTALLLYPRRGGGCVSIGGGWQVCSADAREIPALCDAHFNVWLNSFVARLWLAEVHVETLRGVGITPYGFKLLARLIGRRPRVLWRQINRARDASVRHERRKRGAHDYIDGVLQKRAFDEYRKKNPWAAGLAFGGLGSVLGLGVGVAYAAFAALRKAA